MASEVPSRRGRTTVVGRAIARAGVLAALALVGLAGLGGCGLGSAASPTPEALFARIQELNAEGRTAEIWSLLHPEGKQRQIDAIDQHREFLLKNPGEQNASLVRRQFHCDPEDFQRLDYRELYVRENRGRERWLEGCKTTKKMTDPNNPSDVLVWWGPPTGESFVMRTRFVPGEGYYLIALRE